MQLKNYKKCSLYRFVNDISYSNSSFPKYFLNWQTSAMGKLSDYLSLVSFRLDIFENRWFTEMVSLSEEIGPCKVSNCCYSEKRVNHFRIWQGSAGKTILDKNQTAGKCLDVSFTHVRQLINMSFLSLQFTNTRDLSQQI